MSRGGSGNAVQKRGGSDSSFVLWWRRIRLKGAKEERCFMIFVFFKLLYVYVSEILDFVFELV